MVSTLVTVVGKGFGALSFLTGQCTRPHIFAF